MHDYNRLDTADLNRRVRSALEDWQPSDVDLKLMDPAGRAFVREALHDFFRWAPDSFNDHILGSLLRHSWVLWELVREIGAEHGFRGGTGALSGSWKRVHTVHPHGPQHPYCYTADWNPGLRTFSRGQGETCHVGPSDNRYIRPALPAPEREKPRQRPKTPESAVDGVVN